MMQTRTQHGLHEPISGIIFDLDGTLIRSVVDFPKMKQRMIGYIQNQKIAGTNYTDLQTTVDIISDFAARMTDASIPITEQTKILEKISEILEEVEFENIDKVQLLPGVKQFISDCWFNRIKMGVLTRASKKYTEICLEQTGLIKYFNTVVTRDEFTLLKAKPHPESLKYIINELKIASENILFVGDHKIDYICAQDGHVRFIGVLTGAYDRAIFRDLGHVELVENFYELAEIIKDINKSDRFSTPV